MDGESFTTVLALVGVVIVIAALFSGLIERSNVPQVAVFLALGAVLGPAGLGLLDIQLQSPALRVVATLSLALVLFTDAVTLNVSEVRRQAALALRVLGPGTMLSAALIALAAWWLLGLPPAAAAILGAALASTDPVLLRGLLRRPEIPRDAKGALRLESGLNDIVLLPIVLVAMAFLDPATSVSGPDWGALVLDLFVLGPGAGVLVGVVAVATLDLVRRRVGVRRDYESLYSLGVAFAAFAAAESVHGSGFLAVFAAGLTISSLDVELCDCFLEYGETTSEMALLFAFVLLGTSLIWSGLGILTLAALLFAVVVLLIRPVAFSLSLLGTKLAGRERILISWFGPRGLSTLLLVLLPVFSGVPGSDYMFAVCALVVLLSVTVHGGSLMFLGRLIDRKRAAKEAAATDDAALIEPVAALAIVPPTNNSQIAPEQRESPPDDHLEPPPGPPVTPPSAIRNGAGEGKVAVARDAEGSAPLTMADPALRLREPESDDITERISLDQMRHLQETGEKVLIIDARSERTFELGEMTAKGAIRIDPQRAAQEATRLNLPRDAWLVVFCA